MRNFLSSVVFLSILLGGAIFAQAENSQSVAAVLDQFLKVNQQQSCVNIPSAQWPVCEKKIDQFCKDLYDPKNKLGPGNIDLMVGDEITQIRLGKDQNGNYFSTLALSKARIKNQNQYPSGFKQYLEKYEYAKKVQSLLDMPDNNSLSEKRASRDAASASSAAWNNAFTDASDDEMNRLHPGFAKTKFWPPKWDVEYGEIQRKLQMSINRVTWEKEPAWDKVKNQFKEVQQAYLSVIQSNPNLSPELKKKWSESISTVELKLPGSEDYLLDSPECASTEDNGYYDSKHHIFTVCAGKFNTDTFLRTTAHELGHSIGETRNLQQALDRSPIGQKVNQLSQQLCEKSPYRCSAIWKEIKADLNKDQKLLNSLTHYSSDAQKLRECLQYNKTKKDPKEQLQAVKIGAKSRARSWRSDLAGNKDYITSIKPTTVMEDGSVYDNLSYLNPCDGKPWKSSKFSPKGAMFLFYLAEYQCNGNADPSQKMSESILAAEQAQKDIYEKTIPMGGAFSRDSVMTSNEFASDSEERFADSMGSAVLAKVIEKQNLDPDSKMNKMAANLAIFCDPPNILDRYPEEAQAEKRFDDEPHSLNSTRRREILTKPLRQALQCSAEKDVSECAL